MSLQLEFHKKMYDISHEDWEQLLEDIVTRLDEEGSHQHLQGRQNTTPTEKKGLSAARTAAKKKKPRGDFAIGPPPVHNEDNEQPVAQQTGQTTGISPSAVGQVIQGTLNAVARSPQIKTRVLQMIQQAMRIRGQEAARSMSEGAVK